MTELEFLVGTYTTGSAGGIHKACLAISGEQPSSIALVAEAVNPSWITRLAAQPDMLLAVEEVASEKGPTFRSFRISADMLVPAATAALVGSDPCHIGVHPTRPLAVSAHYSDGSLALWSINVETGAIECLHRIELEGQGPNSARQECAHAHQAVFLEAGACVAIADLGGDALHIFDLGQTESDVLKLRQRLALPPGSGPRHLAVAKNGLYLAAELDERVYAIVCENGVYRVTSDAVAFPGSAAEDGALSAIRLSPDGRFVYVAGRNQNAIAWLEIGVDGALELCGSVDCGGVQPRDFAIDESGRFLIVANQGSGRIVVFTLDPQTGEPVPTGHSLDVESPACICF